MSEPLLYRAHFGRIWARLARMGVFLLILGLALACTGKGGSPTPPPATQAVTATPTVTHPVISEVLAGMPGNNNQDFVELYNPGPEPVDLQGWAVWYRLSDDEPEQVLYRWTEHALLPPGGHYLLARVGETWAVAPDALFDGGNLAPGRGGLQLRRTDGQVVDSVVWGKGPTAWQEGAPAPSFRNGESLERRPGAGAGNGQDTDDNAADFVVRQEPTPQNTGAPAVGPYALPVTLTLTAPDLVAPGETFDLTLTLQAGEALPEGEVRLFVPPDLTVVDLPPTAQMEGQANLVRWTVPALAAGEQAALTLHLQAPWTYATYIFSGYHAVAQGRYAFGAPVAVEVGGGAVPIRVARTLEGAEVVVEGVATMYTGGFYAGSGNVKFYLDDGTGGIQVQVFGGEGQVNVLIGARVRVRGVIGKYRGAVQIVPKRVPDDIEILAPPQPDGEPQPLPVTLAEANSPSLEGRLIQVEGTVTRLEEFSYSYGLDLADQEGHTLTLYLDKLTQARPGDLEVGDLVRVTGILEVLDDLRQLYPRRQSDLERIRPPVLSVRLEAPLTMSLGEPTTLSLRVRNDTQEEMTNLRVLLPLPAGVQVRDAAGGQLTPEGLVWTLDSLPGSGGEVTFTPQVVVTAAAEALAFRGYRAVADQWPQPATGPSRYVFLGDVVPIWAVQGDGFRTPYEGERLTTEGVVVGVFPGLGGFFIQNPTPDDDPFTSEGLFVSVPERLRGLVPLLDARDPAAYNGTLVRVTGTVRELYRQTALEIASADDVQVLGQAAVPQPVVLTPPEDPAQAPAYFEALEGMLVALERGVAVAGTNRYGETVLVPAARFDGTHVFRHEAVGYTVMIDDGSFGSFKYGDEMLYRAAFGDELRGIVGPLAFTYGNYKIEPLQPPQVVAAEHTVTPLPEAPLDAFSVMTWNVENLFDPVEPHPYSPKPPLPGEYRTDVAKVANTIRLAGCPTVVAVQEVENLRVLEDIAAHAALAECPYAAYLIEGHDSRLIDVGYLVRTDRATVVAVRQFDAPEGLTSRPPLVLHLEVQTPRGAFPVYIINNHFTSMAGGELVTEPRRVAQARWVLSIMEQIRREDPAAQFVVLGDLNSYYDSAPLDVLRDEGGLQHVLEWVPPEERYTYIYQGHAQILDHILVTPDLFALLDAVWVLHLNADYPPPDSGDESPFHKSDHDPVVALFHVP